MTETCSDLWVAGRARGDALGESAAAHDAADRAGRAAEVRGSAARTGLAAGAIDAGRLGGRADDAASPAIVGVGVEIRLAPVDQFVPVAVGEAAGAGTVADAVGAGWG